MFAGCLQIMWAHWYLIRVEGIGYSQIIRAENADVCRSCDLCLQAATVTRLLFWFQAIAAKPNNPPNDNQAAVGSETPVNIKAEANKTSVARNLKIIISTPFFY